MRAILKCVGDAADTAIPDAVRPRRLLRTSEWPRRRERSCVFAFSCQTAIRLLSAWQKGDFVADWGQVAADPPAITPEELDRAALENMSGGAFYPGDGGELAICKEKKSGTNRFVLAFNRTGESIPVPGENRRDVIVAAGAFSQQMALPWQADFLDCAADFVVDPNGRGWTASGRVVAYDLPRRSVPGG